MSTETVRRTVLRDAVLPVVHKSIRLNKVLLAAFGLFAAFAVSTPVLAYSNMAYRCDGCTPAQMQQKAISKGPGEQHVFSVPAGVVRLYSVRNQGGAMMAELLAPMPNVVNAVKGLKEIYAATGGTMRYPAVAPASDYGMGTTNAFDLGRSGSLRLQLGDRLMQRPMMSVSANIRELINAASSWFGLADGTEFDVTIQFYDGTSARYNINIAQQRATYVEHSLRTVDGYPIPDENSNQFTGSYSGSDLSRMVDHLRGIGAQLSPQGVGMGFTSITCGWNGSTLHCILRSF